MCDVILQTLDLGVATSELKVHGACYLNLEHRRDISKKGRVVGKELLAEVVRKQQAVDYQPFWCRLKDATFGAGRRSRENIRLTKKRIDTLTE